jgi:hypothetical protein
MHCLNCVAEKSANCLATGHVVNLDNRLEEDAGRVLKERNTYILLEKRLLGKISNPNEKQRARYTPLLINFKEVYPHLAKSLPIVVSERRTKKDPTQAPPEQHNDRSRRSDRHHK